MPKRRRSDAEAVRGKLGNIDGETGSMPFAPPASGRYLVKNSDDNSERDTLDEHVLRIYIAEIVRKCGDDWCLYTKKKDKHTGKRRRLGTHSSKAAAYRQERAIKASVG